MSSGLLHVHHTFPFSAVAGGRIRPLIGGCEVSGGNSVISLEDIEFFGVNEYVVDGRINVTDFTVCLKSGTLIRYNHIEPTETLKGRPGKVTAEKSEKVQEEVSKHVNLPAVLPGTNYRSNEKDKVVKNYPSTTHTRIVEYRLLNRNSVFKLQRSLAETYLEYKSFPLTPKQQMQISRMASCE